ncbi:hypothetical protein KDI_43960 [Dictyobacter arantiisoli]|uniref:Uncharacterized protein n=1 Tax=Dictyobacter arantiisoli TaxID=2014874 RepID=A0A5A5THP7_9CHLR|nr:hypothetical protein KDI_43960 [Dictyobacter arantiisoli]
MLFQEGVKQLHRGFRSTSGPIATLRYPIQKSNVAASMQFFGLLIGMKPTLNAARWCGRLYPLNIEEDVF